MEDYPEELRMQPLPLIGLVGMQEIHATLTKMINGVNVQDAAAAGGGAAAMRVISMNEVSFPTPKPDRKGNFEGYYPLGILKDNWLAKHQKQLPAVLAVFFDFDDDANWKQKEPYLCKQLDDIKQAKRKYMRVVVVLVQHKKSFHSDSALEERMSSLRKHADLDSKQVFLLPMYEVTKVVQRLEKTLVDTAHTCYRDEARRLKKYKEKLNRNSQASLFVRHHFKIAFYGELRQDIKNAFKYYNSCYQWLRELGRAEARLHEIKTVAEYVHFKLCILHFTAGSVTEASYHMRTHLQLYRDAVGPAAVAFDHQRWLGRQYRVFGQLLAKTPSANTSERWQDPGFHFQAAAAAVLNQKRLARQLIPDLGTPKKTEAEQPPAAVESEPTPPVDPLTALATQAQSEPLFVGQTSKFAVCHPLTGGQTSGFEEVALRLVKEERSVDHSRMAVKDLAQAYHHYDTRKKCRRMLLYIRSQIAQQHFECGEFTEACTACEEVVSAYREEGWSQALGSILELLLRCYQKLQKVDSFIETALHLLSPRVFVNTIDKVSLFRTVDDALNGKEPAGENFWVKPSAGLRFPLDSNHSYLTCCVHLPLPVVKLHSDVVVQVSVTAHFCAPIQISSLTVVFGDPAYNITFLSGGENASPAGLLIKEDDIIAEDVSRVIGQKAPLVTASKLLLLPEQRRLFTVSFPARETTTLEVTHVEVHIGAPAAGLHLTHAVSDHVREIHLEALTRVLTGDLATPQLPPDDQLILSEQRCLTRVMPPEAKMTIEAIHYSPALVSETFSVVLRIHSNDDAVLKGDATATAVLSSKPHEVLHKRDSGELVPFKGCAVPSLEANQTHDIKLFLTPTTPGDVVVIVKVQYESSSHHMNLCERSIPISVAPVLTPSFHFYSLPTQQCVLPLIASSAPTGTAPPPDNGNVSRPLTMLRMGEKVMLACDMECHSSVITILSTKFSANKSTSTVEDASAVEVAPGGVALCSGELCRVCSIITPVASHKNENLGTLSVTWQRSSEPEVPPHTLTLPLPIIPVLLPEFSVTFDAPTEAVVGEPVQMSLCVDNRTTLPQTLSVVLSASDQFYAAGCSLSTLHVLPSSSKRIRFVVVPVLTGHHCYPHAHVVAVGADDARSLDHTITQVASNRVFVHPMAA